MTTMMSRLTLRELNFQEMQLYGTKGKNSGGAGHIKICVTYCDSTIFQRVNKLCPQTCPQNLSPALIIVSATCRSFRLDEEETKTPCPPFQGGRSFGRPGRIDCWPKRWSSPLFLISPGPLTTPAWDPLHPFGLSREIRSSDIARLHPISRRLNSYSGRTREIQGTGEPTQLRPQRPTLHGLG